MTKLNSFFISIKDNLLLYLLQTFSIGFGYAYTLINPPSNQIQSSLTRFLLVSIYLLALSFDNLPTTSSGIRYILIFILSFASWALLIYVKFAGMEYKTQDYQILGDLVTLGLFILAFGNWLYVTNKVIKHF